MIQIIILLVLLQNKSQIEPVTTMFRYFRRAVNMQVIGHFRHLGRCGVFWKGNEQETQLSAHYPGFPPTPLKCCCSGHQCSLCFQIQCTLFCLPRIPPSVEFNKDGNFLSTNMLLSELLRHCTLLLFRLLVLSFFFLCSMLTFDK